MSSKIESFDVTELVGLFREALIALLPVTNKSRLAWREGESYDPWEDIEQALYESIIGSCILNATALGRIMPLASYGLERANYADRSFLVPSDNKGAVFLRLVRAAAFDEAIFLELGDDLTPSKNRFRRSLTETQFLLAVPKDGRQLEFHQRIEYYR